jgi:hypothetical protein
VCPDILVCTPLEEAVCAKLLTRSRPEVPQKKSPSRGARRGAGGEGVDKFESEQS